MPLRVEVVDAVFTFLVEHCTHSEQDAMKQRRRPHSLPNDHPQIVKDGQVTHVLVPIDQYQQLVAESLLAEAVSRSSSESKWTGAREVGLRLAGKRIAAARKALGLTQKDLAGRLGIAQSEVSRIENRPENTTVRTLRKVAEALEVDVRALI